MRRLTFRHVVEPSPRHRERLGYHVSRLLRIGPTQGVAEHARHQIRVQRFEPCPSSLVRRSLLYPGDVASPPFLTWHHTKARSSGHGPMLGTLLR